jgi:membrane protein implicated in regulation of membrane protease activity
MLKFFQVCFVTGALFTVVSFLLGQVTHIIGMDAHVGHMDAGGHIDTGGLDTGHIDASTNVAHTEAAIDMHIPFLPISPLKPIIIASFVTVFGGVGIICLQKDFPQVIALLIAFAIAFTVSALLYSFLLVPLYRAQSTSAVSQKELIGSMAKSVLKMEGNTYGKITYSIGGNTYSAPAKSIDGKEINSGVYVVIIDIKKSTFLVKEIKGGM